MKNLLKLFIVLLIAVNFSSCTDEFDEINKNPKALTLASLDAASYGFVFKKSIMGPSYLQGAGNGMQLIHSLYFDIYANYWATTTPNFLSDRYVMVGSWLNGAFNSFYASEAAQIKYSEDFTRTNDLKGELAMAKIWKVWCYHRYTDALGPIPYSKYGNFEKTVPYDKQQNIYTAFFAELDSAENILKGLTGQTSGILSKYDMIYGGKLDKWRKFGNSLHLRLGMRLKYAAPTVAKAECEKAVANGIISDNADNGWITTSSDFQNPYNIISPWAEYRMSADMESILKGYLDPRVASYFKAAKTPDPTDDPAGVSFPYEGVRNGQTKNDRSAVKFDELGSDHALPYTIVGAAGPKWFVMRAFEGYLLRAEGVLEGWNMGGGTVQSLYNEGILMSLAENGYADANLKGDPYTTSALVPASPGIDKNTVIPQVAPAPVSTAPIAFLSGGTKEQQLEQIITQKWIGLLPDSQEAYAERRRTGYPKLYPRLESENTDVAATSLPVRLTYWTSEYTNNKAAVETAIQTLNGESTTPNGDKATTKLWWDKK
ncbi:MAG: hypothetical protein A2X04_08925 [Bacteroidetes bacterium GWF2_41_9]|nr:MAG: hypothetical protein A2X04_08925 [Bacteroidetes bacterium GWF2_41_9]HAM11437.1 SusD/RagB family nutrient-binding outer membrane lipoprotein [Bacteroidales bacterium]HBH85017.1 SusD/RagB family nutrient-binding outer membrane lipoprotein [Bacteroidales bacterium]